MNPTAEEIEREERQARRIASLVREFLGPVIAHAAHVPAMLSVAEFACAAGVAEETVRVWVRTQRIPSVCVSRTIPYQINRCALPDALGISLAAAAERLAQRQAGADTTGGTHSAAISATAPGRSPSQR